MMVTNKRRSTGLIIKKRFQKVISGTAYKKRSRSRNRCVYITWNQGYGSLSHVTPHLFIVPYLMSSVCCHLGNKGKRLKSRNSTNETVKSINTLILQYHVFKKIIIIIQYPHSAGLKELKLQKTTSNQIFNPRLQSTTLFKKYGAMCSVGFFFQCQHCEQAVNFKNTTH